MATIIRQRFPQPATMLSSQEEMSEFKYYVHYTTTRFGIQGLNRCINVHGNGTALPNCVGYCYGRMLETYGLTTLPGAYYGLTGNAHDWIDKDAVRSGGQIKFELPYKMKNNQYDPHDDYATDNNGNLIPNPNCRPRAGAIMVWRGGRQGFGHVAFVEKVIDGSFNNMTVTQSYSGYDNVLYVTNDLDPFSYNGAGSQWLSHDRTRDTRNRLYNKNGSGYYFLGFIYPPPGIVVRDYTYKLSFDGTDSKLLTATGKEWII